MKQTNIKDSKHKDKKKNNNKLKVNEKGLKPHQHTQKRKPPKNTGVANGEDLPMKHKLILDEWISNGYNKSQAVMEVLPDIKHQSSACHTFNAIAGSKQGQKYMQHLQENLALRNHISRESVLHEFSSWAFVDATQLLGDSETEKRLKALPAEVRRAIQSIKVSERTETLRNGNPVTTVTTDIKLVNKLDALREAAKIIGAFSLDNSQKASNINVGMMPDELKLSLLNYIRDKTAAKQNESNTIDVTHS